MSKELSRDQGYILRVLKEDMGFRYLWRHKGVGMLHASTHPLKEIKVTEIDGIEYPDGYRDCNLARVLNPEMLYAASSLVGDDECIGIEELLELPVVGARIIGENRDKDGKLFIYEEASE